MKADLEHFALFKSLPSEFTKAVKYLLGCRFVSGGCDSLVKIWKEGEDGHWTEDTKLDAHSDWVRNTGICRYL
jgi:hypothetical protein